MKVKVNYTTQLKHALGRTNEEVELTEPATAEQLIAQLSQTHGAPFDKLMLDKQHQLNSAILVCLGDESLGRNLSKVLKEGDEITFLSPVSGG